MVAVRADGLVDCVFYDLGFLQMEICGPTLVKLDMLKHTEETNLVRFDQIARSMVYLNQICCVIEIF